MIQKPAETEQKLASIIAERWSGKSFDASQPVSDETITALCEAALWAPSCYGEAPWRYVICNKFDDAASWQQTLECLSPGNQTWAVNAPLLIVTASQAKFTHNGLENRWNGYDTGAASLNLCLQATAVGLMSHQMGGFDADKLRKSLSIPSEINLWSVIAIGYPAALDTLTAEQLEQELKARQRRPLSEHFFINRWSD
ncbi:nitroreductase [Methylophaga sp. SB9B]|nr:nitroreductase family protein [Methylophaga sp. SB9B]THK40669.1 nitroreductase [Methylophaga sp. SB9B]